MAVRANSEFYYPDAPFLYLVEDERPSYAPDLLWFYEAEAQRREVFRVYHPDAPWVYHPEAATAYTAEQVGNGYKPEYFYPGMVGLADVRPVSVAVRERMNRRISAILRAKRPPLIVLPGREQPPLVSEARPTLRLLETVVPVASTLSVQDITLTLARLAAVLECVTSADMPTDERSRRLLARAMQRISAQLNRLGANKNDTKKLL